MLNAVFPDFVAPIVHCLLTQFTKLIFFVDGDVTKAKRKRQSASRRGSRGDQGKFHRRIKGLLSGFVLMWLCSTRWGSHRFL